MTRVLIVGAGGFGREVLEWLRSPTTPRGFEVGGFLDDNPDALHGYERSVGVVGRISDYEPQPDDLLVMGIGQVRAKLACAEKLLARGARFTSLVHSTAHVGSTVGLGVGCVICPYACITCDVQVGDFVILNVAASVGHNATIGDGCTLNGHCDINGGATLGRGVLVGSHACVLPGVRVGDFATIGAGSAVIKPVAERTTVVGVPAKRIALPGGH